MEGEPAEAEEDFQFELLKVMKKISKTLEDINCSLNEMKSK